MKSGMQLFYPILILGLFSAISLFGQKDSVEHWRQKGIDRFDNDEFQDAINAFDLAKTFDGAEAFKDIESWIQKSYEGYVVQLQEARDAANLEAKIGNLVGTAYVLAKQNPTHALRVLEAAQRLKADNKSTLLFLNDLISTPYPAFYNQMLKHEDEVSATAACPDADWLVTGSFDGKAWIWNTAGVLQDSLIGHQEAISTVAISPNGQLIATGSWDNEVKIWTKEGELLHTLEDHIGDISSIDFSPDGTHLATASWDKTFKIWEVASGTMLMTVNAHEDYVSSIRYAPNGQSILTGSWDKSLKLWDINGQLLQIYTGHSGSVSSVAFSPDGATIASGSWDRTLRTWSKKGQLLNEFIGHEDTVDDIEFSKDGKHLFSASADRTARLWNLAGAELQSYRGHSNKIRDLALSSDGKRLYLASSDFYLSQWALRGNEISAYPQENEVMDLAFTKDGHMLCGLKNGTSVLIDNQQNVRLKLIGHKDEVTSVAISPDEQYYVTGSKDNKLILWDKTGNQLQIYKEHDSDVTDVAFSPDGQWILSGSWDDEARIWDLEGNCKLVYKGHSLDIYSVAISPDQSYIVTGSRDRSAHVWTPEGELIAKLSNRSGKISAVAISHDNSMILTGSNDQNVKLWSREGKLLRILRGHQKLLKAVAFSPDDKLILSVSEDQVAKVWDLQGNELQNYYGHTETIHTAVFHPDGRSVVSTGGDKVINTWLLKSAYLQTDQIMPLALEDKVNYGLDISDQERLAYEEQKKNKKRKPFHPENILVGVEKSLEKEEDHNYRLYLSHYYSMKAYLSKGTDVLEKIALQETAVTELERSFAIKPAQIKLSRGSINTQSWMYMNLAIWHLANQNTDKALEMSQKSLSYEPDESFRAILDLKRALILSFDDQMEEAKKLIMDQKEKEIPTNKEFHQVFGLVQGFYMQEEDVYNNKMKFLIKDDLQYLQKLGVNHPNLDLVKQLLEAKP